MNDVERATANPGEKRGSPFQHADDDRCTKTIGVLREDDHRCIRWVGHDGPHHFSVAD